MADGAGVRIERVTEAGQELVDAFARLVPQLSKSSPAPTLDDVADMLANDRTHVFVARLGPGDGDQGAIVGTLTLATFRIPTGVRAWIEDVIVDEAAGGHGIGTRLTEHALDVARQLGAKTVDLTSRPSREAANHIYRKVGFKERETNVYRYDLDA